MPTIRLTQIAVDRLKPPASGRVEFWDSQLPGFGLRISAPRPGAKDGRKTWQAMYRVEGKLVRETISTLVQEPDVEKAREKAKASMRQAKQDIHPVEQRKRVKAEERRAAEAEGARQRDTLAVILDRYVGEYGAKRWRPDTLKEVKRAFEADVKPVLGARPIRDITQTDVCALIDAIVARGRAPHAHHVLAYLRPAFKWAAKPPRLMMTTNPAAGIDDPDPRKLDARSRDRYLDDDEIRLFWLACDKIGWPFGPMFKLLLLTGQRRDELADATWPEFDLYKALWTLPGARAKNGKEHLVHLAPSAISIIKTLPQIGRKGFLFTTTGELPVSGFGRARDRLAARMAEMRRVGDGEGEGTPIAPFTLHDLRRTAATGMAGIGIAHHVLDRVLNHTGGKISGVGAIYNKFEYLTERKAALDAWARHIESLIEPMPSNVIVRLSRPGRS